MVGAFTPQKSPKSGLACHQPCPENWFTSSRWGTPPEPILSPPQAAPSPRPAHVYNPNRTEVLDKGRDPHWLAYSLPGASPCLGRLSLSVHICPHGFTSALYPKGSSELKVTCYGPGPGLWWLPAEVGQEGLVRPPRGKGDCSLGWLPA